MQIKLSPTRRQGLSWTSVRPLPSLARDDAPYPVLDISSPLTWPDGPQVGAEPSFGGRYGPFLRDPRWWRGGHAAHAAVSSNSTTTAIAAAVWCSKIAPNMSSAVIRM